MKKKHVSTIGLAVVLMVTAFTVTSCGLFDMLKNNVSVIGRWKVPTELAGGNTDVYISLGIGENSAGDTVCILAEDNLGDDFEWSLTSGKEDYIDDDKFFHEVGTYKVSSKSIEFKKNKGLASEIQAKLHFTLYGAGEKVLVTPDIDEWENGVPQSFTVEGHTFTRSDCLKEGYDD